MADEEETQAERIAWSTAPPWAQRLRHQLSLRFDRIDSRLDQVETRLDSVEAAVGAYDRNVSASLSALRRLTAEDKAQIILATTNPPPRPASALRVTIEGESMPVQVDVDVQNERIVAQFVDDKGDVTTRAPVGPDGSPATISYASSDPTVAAADATSGALTINKAGTVTFSASAVDSSGTPVDGFTGSVDVEFTPGVATALQVSVAGGEPQPIGS